MCWFTKWRYRHAWTLHPHTNAVHAFIQRGRRGWASSDTWNTDTYLARVIAEMLHYLADSTMGYPPPFETHADWVCYLHQVATRFEEYTTRTLDVGYDQRSKDLVVLFEHFGDLWS